MGIRFDLNHNFRRGTYSNDFKPLASDTDWFVDSYQPIYHLEYRKNPHTWLSSAPLRPQIHP